MAETIEASVVIPVFNQWRLTRQCLASLARTTEGESIEVIVIDNASTDETALACPALGEGLFGGRFVYRRAGKNLNFGPASNLGARIARGPRSSFSTTTPSRCPAGTGRFCEIGMNCPTSPRRGRYCCTRMTGLTVRQTTGETPGRGVAVPSGGRFSTWASTSRPFSRWGTFTKAYPRTRRLRKSAVSSRSSQRPAWPLFQQAGGFDERYINGFEDFDLCASLWSQGLSMTVNPQSRVMHRTSQTPGRFGHDIENSQLARKLAVPLFVPNLHTLTKNDTMRLSLSPWQNLRPAPPPAVEARLEKFADKAPSQVAQREILMRLAVDHPFWEEGLARLCRQAATPAEKRALLEHAYKLFRSPDDALTLYTAERL